MSRATRLILLALLTGCGGHDPLVTEEEHDLEFVGEWVIDQPAHALYEATRYSFESDGTLIMEDSCTLSEPEDYVTGNVQNDLGTTICRFGDRWRSDGPEILIVRGDCDDGAARDIVLAVGASRAEVVSVGGDPAWDHHTFEWRWLKCEPLSFCDPYWCD